MIIAVCVFLYVLSFFGSRWAILETDRRNDGAPMANHFLLWWFTPVLNTLIFTIFGLHLLFEGSRFRSWLLQEGRCKKQNDPAS